MTDTIAPSTALPVSGKPHPFSPQFLLKIFILIQLTLLGFEFSPDISTNGDDAKYYLLGKSLMSGNGYCDLFDPANPVQTQYPPLFPALVGIAGLITHSPLLPKIAVGIASAGILLLLFYYLQGPLFSALLLPLLLIMALSASLASHATLLMSEIPYLFASLAALIFFETQRKRKRLDAVFWIIAFLAVTPALIRTVGIAFSAAWILAAIIDKRYKQAGAYALLFIGIMVLLRFATEWNSPYIDQLFRKNQYDPELGFATAAELFTRIGQNLDLYIFSIIPQTLLGQGLSKNGSITAAVLLVAPALIGWIRNFRRPTALISYYLLFYAVIICMWQTQWSSPRFIIPIIPFLVLFILSGIEFLLRFLCEQIKKPAAAPQSDHPSRTHLTTGVLWIVAIIFCLYNVADHSRLLKSSDGTTNDWKNFYSCADWVRLNTPVNAIVVNRKPELFYLRAERKGFVYPFSHDVEKIIAALKKGNVRYCVLDNFYWTNTSVRYLFPAIMSHPEMFHVVYSLRNPDTYVLEFTPK